MFKKILIANRGEIAIRILRACKELGVKTVAVYSDADKNSQHAQLADEAIHIGASSPKESYLNADVLIQAALASQADAIHPGYGFLSENASFAGRVASAHLTFIGPSADSIRAMGASSATTARSSKRRDASPCVRRARSIRCRGSQGGRCVVGMQPSHFRVCRTRSP